MSLKDFEKIYPGIRNNEGYGTDKFILGYVHEFYAEHFDRIKDNVKSVMEIGIGYSPGGDSILLWHEFFSNAKIYGIDIQTRPDRPEFHIEQPRIKLFAETNAYTQEMVNTMCSLEPDGYDIFIDDGPHTFDTMKFAIQHYLPLVKSGGIFVIEDIVDRSWTPELCKLIDPNIGNIKVYDMRNKQRHNFWLDIWKNGLDVIVVKKV